MTLIQLVNIMHRSQRRRSRWRGISRLPKWHSAKTPNFSLRPGILIINSHSSPDTPTHQVENRFTVAAGKWVSTGLFAKKDRFCFCPKDRLLGFLSETLLPFFERVRVVCASLFVKALYRLHMPNVAECDLSHLIFVFPFTFLDCRKWRWLLLLCLGCQWSSKVWILGMN